GSGRSVSSGRPPRSRTRFTMRRAPGCVISPSRRTCCWDSDPTSEKAVDLSTQRPCRRLGWGTVSTPRVANGTRDALSPRVPLLQQIRGPHPVDVQVLLVILFRLADPAHTDPFRRGDRSGVVGTYDGEQLVDVLGERPLRQGLSR